MQKRRKRNHSIIIKHFRNPPPFRMKNSTAKRHDAKHVFIVMRCIEPGWRGHVVLDICMSLTDQRFVRGWWCCKRCRRYNIRETLPLFHLVHLISIQKQYIEEQKGEKVVLCTYAKMDWVRSKARKTVKRRKRKEKRKKRREVSDLSWFMKNITISLPLRAPKKTIKSNNEKCQQSKSQYKNT